MDTHAILEKVGNGPPFLEVLSMDKIQYPSQNEDQFQHIVGSRESQTVLKTWLKKILNFIIQSKDTNATNNFFLKNHENMLLSFKTE